MRDAARSLGPGWLPAWLSRGGPRRVAGALAASAAALVAGVALAATLTLDLENMSPGSPDGQDGWSADGSAGQGCAVYDHQIVADTGVAGFGTRTLRVSNAVTSGCFSDQTFTKSLADEAGETSAVSDGQSGGTRQSYFEGEWQFISADPNTPQTGLSVVVSPDRGDGARMSWVQMLDTANGIDINFNEYRAGTGFVPRPVVAGLPRNQVHTVKVTMQFVDGAANDIVRVYVNGQQRLSGTSWEDYYREEESNPTRPVDSLLFRTGGTAVPATAGKGFFIDNIRLTSGPAPAAPSTVYVRPDGDDLTCSGEADAAATAAPNCAVKTIQEGVDRVATGGTVVVGAGTYAENVTISKRITLDGAGSTEQGTIVDPASGIGIAIAAGGSDANARLTIKDLRATGAGSDGIRMQGNVSHLTLDNVAAVGNGENGVGVASGDLQDVEIKNSALSANGNAGLRIATEVGAFDGLKVTNTQVLDNAIHGLITGPSGSVGVTNVQIEGSEFRRNGTSATTGGEGDISLFGFNGNASISNTVIEGDAQIALQIRGVGVGSLASLGPVAPAGTVSLTNVQITGNPARGLQISSYSSLPSFTMSGVSINTQARTGVNTYGLVLDLLGGALNLGNTSLAGDATQLIVYFTNPTVNVDATGATFVGLTDPFAIEDRISHGIDRPGVGVVTYVANNVYVTPNSFALPATTAPDIQRGVDAVPAGGTVNVAAGTFANAVTIGKAVTVKGQGPASTILDGSGLPVAAGQANGFTVNADGVTIRDLKVTGYKVDNGGSGRTTGNGVYAGQPRSNISIANVDASANQRMGIFFDQPPTNLTIDGVVANGNNPGCDGGRGGRGIILWNGAKQNVTIKDSTASNNCLVGIDLSDGSVTGLTLTGNTVVGNGDAGIAVLGAEGPGANLIANNTVTNNGRFGIEIKNPTGNGQPSGPGSVVVDGNVVSRTVAATDARDHMGIGVFRRSVDPNFNAAQPSGVVVQNNEVSGIRGKGQQNGGIGDGMGIVVEGTGMVVRNNSLGDNDVAIQAQAGNPSNPAGDADQAAPDEFFGRGNANAFSGTIELNNIAPSNTIGLRNPQGSTATVNAERNWWGSPTGPTNAGNPGGTGASVVGQNVDFSPWLGDGTDTQPSARGFQPNAALLYAVPTRLTFQTQPGGANEGSPLSPQPVVRAEDADGNLGINFNAPVTLALTNPQGAALGGTNPVAAQNGVATFTGLSVNDDGTYTLTATATFGGNNLTGTSSPFTVANVGPSSVQITSPSSNASFAVGQPVQVAATFTGQVPPDGFTCVITSTGNGPVNGQVTPPSGNQPGQCTGQVTFATAGPKTITVTINDDDQSSAQTQVNVGAASPSVIVTPTTGLQTTEAGGTAQFTVRLSANPTSNVTIALSSSDATEGTVAPATLTFTPQNGTVAQTVTVTGVDDQQADGAVAYTIVTGPTQSADALFNNLDVADVAVTNQDNDSFPTLSVSDATATEGQAGAAGTLTFTVTLSPPADRTVTVAYATEDGTARSISDYQAVSGTLTFASGETTKTVTVQTVSDDRSEGAETLVLRLSNPTNATLSDATGTGTIQDDELPASSCSPRPNIAVNVERAGANRLTVTVAVDRSGPNSANTLEAIRFEQPRNARVELPGRQPHTTGSLTVPLGNGATRYTFTVERIAPGQAVHVPMFVRDACGERETFVGGGVAAF